MVSVTDLLYRSRVLVEDLALNECTLHRCSGSGAARWWQLWWLANRDTDGKPEDFCVPVNPGGSYNEHGPGGRTWGLTLTAAGIWQVSPSINVLASRDAIAGNGPSIWHQTPRLVGVPERETWAFGDTV
jgi:hypothetical protein